jgi:phosphoribosyl-AMP cyclohydrolase
MNRTAIERTLAEGFACYWSRSRSAYWRKGETSGHLQRLVELRFDCDGDAVLLRVEQTGPACHTNRPDCFYLLADGTGVRVTSDPV